MFVDIILINFGLDHCNYSCNFPSNRTDRLPEWGEKFQWCAQIQLIEQVQEGHTIVSITESLSPPGCFNVKIGEFSSGEKYGTNELPSTRHKAGCNIPPCGVDAQVFTMEHVAWVHLSKVETTKIARAKKNCIP